MGRLGRTSDSVGSGLPTRGEHYDTPPCVQCSMFNLLTIYVAALLIRFDFCFIVRIFYDREKIYVYKEN